ncbi:MAG TPA: hypothetical protein VE954_16360 [Oligoflexus sp.]|uniref:hypothetical protein n=1 Tax=Oligoflexus sp. TaxID=1971216 RepID=UPI002D4BF224|nr:hypothetical protein [Oligoflexus sp.]HYX34672.1 hypothetical protein [Oligoflexus sp.]
MDNNPRDETSQTLLDDADILRLMEAEYKNSQTPVDELEKQRIWSGIKRQLPTKRTKFHRGWLLVAAVVLGLAPLVKILDNQDELGIKGMTSETDARLEIQLLNVDGRPQKVEQGHVGQTLLFKVSSPTASYLALALQIDGGIPEVQFQLHSPVTGQDQILAEQEQAFVYQLDQPGQTLKFCLLATRNRDDLQQRMDNLMQHWPRIGAKLCQTLSVQ